MNTLHQAVQEYLTMRRSLGFKLRNAGKLLLAFVKFMEQRRASYVTTKLALAWAHRLSVVRTFARHRSATDPRTQIPPEGLLPYRPQRARPYLYSAKEGADSPGGGPNRMIEGGPVSVDEPRSEAYCAQRSRYRPAGGYDPGHTNACSDY